MSDPMDTPPTDHGSDRHGYVEIQGEGWYDAEHAGWVLPEPSGEWFEKLLAEPCADCNANLFIRWIGKDGAADEDRNNWHVTVAHDAGCVRLAAEER